MMTVIREQTSPSIRFTSAPMAHHPRKRQQDNNEENESRSWCLCHTRHNTKAMNTEYVQRTAHTQCYYSYGGHDEWRKEVPGTGVHTRRTARSPVTPTIMMWCRCLLTGTKYQVLGYQILYFQYYCPDSWKKVSARNCPGRHKQATYKYNICI